MLSWTLPFPKIETKLKITHQHRLFLIGSCFSTHIRVRLQKHKFIINPVDAGNLFDPKSIGAALEALIRDEVVLASDLFYYEELWHSWAHHSQFSGTDKALVLRRLQQMQAFNADFLKKTDVLFLTFGTAWAYQLKETGAFVANCHKYPQNCFHRRLLRAEEITEEWLALTERLQAFNERLKIVVTVSPVRHLPGHLAENNRSKAALIEAAHRLCAQMPAVFSYFPAYEILIDVLRDYRFYDIDGIHPNYQATNCIFDYFTETFMSAETQAVMAEVRPLATAMKHQGLHTHTQKYRQFLAHHLELAQTLAQKYPCMDFTEEVQYFSEKICAL